MPKDYAKRNTRSRGRPKKKQKAKPHWKLWLFTICCIALFIFILVHLSGNKKAAEAMVKSLPVPMQKIVKVKTKIKAPQAAQPKFDFYTILPNEKIKVMPVPKSGVQYVLQIAVVKKFAEADRLKAELALLGFDAFVTKVKERDGEVSRVLVGPYFSKKAAVIDQGRLLQNQIKSILRKEKS